MEFSPKQLGDNTGSFNCMRVEILSLQSIPSTTPLDTLNTCLSLQRSGMTDGTHDHGSNANAVGRLLRGKDDGGSQFAIQGSTFSPG